MKSLIVTLCIGLISLTSLSQSCASCWDAVAVHAFKNPVIDYNNNFVEARGRNNGFQGKGRSNNNMASQYLNAFEISKINYEGKSLYVMARYNAISKEIEVDLKEGIINLNKNEGLIIVLTKSRKTYECISFMDSDGKFGNEFFEKISNNSRNLVYKKEILHYKEGKKAITGYDKPRPPKYVLSENYYLQNNSKQLLALSTKRKNIQKTFPSNAKGILKFIKDNDISIDNTGDIMSLAGHIAKLDKLNFGETTSRLAKN